MYYGFSHFNKSDMYANLNVDVSQFEYMEGVRAVCQWFQDIAIQVSALGNEIDTAIEWEYNATFRSALSYTLTGIYWVRLSESYGGP